LEKPKPTIVLFLGCLGLALFSLSSAVSSQSLTTSSFMRTFTSTSIDAVTSTSTSTGLVPQSVRYDLTPLDFNNQTGTFTLSYTDTAPYYPSNPLCLMYDYFLVNATTAYEYKVHFDTQQDVPIHFLILNIGQFNEFNHINCANGFSDWELRQVAPASDLVWIVPQPGEYVFLFFSRQFVGGYIRLLVQAYGQTIQTSTSTYSTNSTLEAVSSQTALLTLPVTTTTTSTHTYSIWDAGPIIIVTVVLIATAVMIKRTSTSRTKKPPSAITQSK